MLASQASCQHSHNGISLMDIILSVPIIIRILFSAGQHNTLTNNKHTVLSDAALNLAINYSTVAIY